MGIGSAIRRFSQRLDRWRYGAIDPAAPLGRRGEQAAARLLRRKGYQIVAESERDRGGEIDLIAVDYHRSTPRRRHRRRTIVFVEVKTFASRRPGHPAERVDQDKQGRLTRAALRFLRRHRLLEHAARFDVVAIWWTAGGAEPERIEHYENAFEPVGHGQWFC